ncbi:hypothetical protein ACVIGA_007723 [Bradyrhizobium sp. USDA 3240]
MARPSWEAKRHRTRQGRSDSGAPEEANFLKRSGREEPGPQGPAGKKGDGEGFGWRSASHRSSSPQAGDRTFEAHTVQSVTAPVGPRAARLDKSGDCPVAHRRNRAEPRQERGYSPGFPRCHQMHRDWRSASRCGENSRKDYVSLSLSAPECGPRRPYANRGPRRWYVDKSRFITVCGSQTLHALTSARGLALLIIGEVATLQPVR